jgi:hypothetical protein
VLVASMILHYCKWGCICSAALDFDEYSAMWSSMAVAMDPKARRDRK